MGLKDRYAQMTGAAPASPVAAPASAAPSTPPPSTPTSAAPSEASASSLPAAASPATGSPAPAGRDLAAVRARLAQRTSPGVNPPEAAIPPAAFDRTTKEGPAGEAIPLENHQEVLKAAAKAAVAGVAPAASPAGELTRGQKAAATRAANKAAASTVAPVAAAAPSEPAPAATEEFVGACLQDFTLEQLLREVVRRVS